MILLLRRSPACSSFPRTLSLPPSRPFSLSSYPSVPPTHASYDFLIRSSCLHGHLHRAIALLSSHPSAVSDLTYSLLLQACSERNHVSWTEQIRAHIMVYSPNLTDFLGDHLVASLARCGLVEEALEFSAALTKRTVFSCTAIISAYADCDCGYEALRIYEGMLQDQIVPNTFTFVGLFRACSSVQLLVQGKKIHVEARERSFTSNLFISNTLISMYGKCGEIVEAHNIFVALSKRDIVSWTAMISAYVGQGHGEEALRCYQHMREDGTVPADPLILSMALVACRMLAKRTENFYRMGKSPKMKALETGHALHADAHKEGYESDAFVLTNIVNMYGECGAIAEAENVFDSLVVRDTIAWTAMLSAYVEHGEGEKALELYKSIRFGNFTFDSVTHLYILQACSEGEDLVACREVHFDIICAGYDSISSMASTLVHTYGNCLSLADAETVFSKHPDPDIIAWNVYMAVHVREGNISLSLHSFEHLRRANIKPDDVTFILALSACSYGGLVEKALEYLQSMRTQYNLTPDIKHYNIILELLGRAGDFEGVYNILGSMPMQADIIVWLCILSACHAHGNIQVARQAFRNAVNLQPRKAFAYVIMSKLYADAELRELASEFDVNKTCLEGGGNVHKGSSGCWIDDDDLNIYSNIGDRQTVLQNNYWQHLLSSQLKNGSKSTSCKF